MTEFALKDVISACGGRPLFEAADVQIKDVTIDSRRVSNGSVFVCIKGERLDGHDFIESALKNGAAAVISEKPAKGNIILVDSALDAFQSIAAAYAEQFDIPRIGVTGSVGKTTTKELLYSVLSQKYRTFKNEANLNSQTGVPITLLKLAPEYEAAVIEMGMSKFGEMDRLAKMVRPTLAVYTNIGESHIEFLGSKDGIFNAKTEMLKYLPENALVIINGDDPILARIKAMRKNVVSCGFSEENDCYAYDISERGFEGSEFTVSYKGKQTRAFMPAPGKYMILNALVCVAAAEALGVERELAIKGIASFIPPEGRMKIINTGRLTLLSDAYNANPTSVRASIDTALSGSGRKVLILGDMYELGENSPEYHRSIGEYAASKGADIILTVGELAKDIYDGAKKCGADVLWFADTEDLHNALPSLLSGGDTVLVKASHGMHLERTAEYIKGL